MKSHFQCPHCISFECNCTNCFFVTPNCPSQASIDVSIHVVRMVHDAKSTANLQIYNNIKPFLFDESRTIAIRWQEKTIV